MKKSQNVGTKSAFTPIFLHSFIEENHITHLKN